MPRIGMNPNRQAQAERFTNTVLTCVTHLPHQNGYHANRLEVIQTCLETMRWNANGDYTVIVWDNGSCDELRDWLRNKYIPDVLIESINIGKTQARLNLAMMLGGRTMAYTDDDILFMPNWLSPQLDLLHNYPNVAAVTGYLVRTAFRWGVENTIKWASTHGKMTAGRFIPSEWERDFAISIGRDPQAHEEMTRNDIDYKVEYNGRTAYLTSHHCQFVAHASAVVLASQRDASAMGDEKPFDVALDKLGLRLATTERLTRHIGNVMDAEIRRAVNFQ